MAGARPGGRPRADPRDVVDDVLVQVDGVEVTVVVEEELREHLGVRAQGAQGLEDEDLLLEGGVGRLEDAEEDVLDEDLDLGFEVGLELSHLGTGRSEDGEGERRRVRPTQAIESPFIYTQGLKLRLCLCEQCMQKEPASCVVSLRARYSG